MSEPPSNRRGAPPSATMALAVLCTGIFLAALDQAVVYGALPDVMVSLRLPVTSLDRVSWVVIGYLLGYTAAMPLVGRISDVHGHGKTYIGCLVTFMAGSVLTALAPNLSWMIAARVVQAIGGGALIPVAMAIMATLTPRENRSVAIGAIGAAAEAGAVLGPLYGALMAQYLDWRWIFWANMPIVLLIVALSRPFLLRPDPAIAGRVDYAGGILLAASLTLLSLGLYLGLGTAHRFLPFILLTASSAVAFVLFLLRQAGKAQPLFRLALFRHRNFSAANISHFMVGGALIIALVSVPLMADTIMGKTPLEGGLRLIRLTAAIPVGAIAGGYICRMTDCRIPTLLGLALSAVGFWFMSQWKLDVADPALTLQLAATGLGFGLVIAPINTAVVNSVGEAERGVAASLATVTRLMGMIVSLSALSAWGMSDFFNMTAGLTLNDLTSSPELLAQPVLSLFQRFFLVGSGLCVLGMVPAMWLRKA